MAFEDEGARLISMLKRVLATLKERNDQEAVGPGGVVGYLTIGVGTPMSITSMFNDDVKAQPIVVEEEEDDTLPPAPFEDPSSIIAAAPPTPAVVTTETRTEPSAVEDIVMTQQERNNIKPVVLIPNLEEVPHNSSTTVSITTSDVDTAATIYTGIGSKKKRKTVS